MYDGLYDIFFDDGFVYFVNEAGEPAPWRGFRNTLTDNENCYKVCSVHTQAAWEEQRENGGFFGDGDDGWGNDGFDNGNFGDNSGGNNGGNTGGNSGSFWG